MKVSKTDVVVRVSEHRKPQSPSLPLSVAVHHEMGMIDQLALDKIRSNLITSDLDRIHNLVSDRVLGRRASQKQILSLPIIGKVFRILQNNNPYKT